MFFLRPFTYVFWEKLRFKIIFMSAQRFFVITGIFGLIFTGLIVSLIFFRSHFITVGIICFFILLIWSSFAVYSKLHSFFWTKREARKIGEELDKRLKEVGKKSRTEEDQTGMGI